MSEQKKQKIEHTPLYTLCRVIFGTLFRTLCPIRYYNRQVLDRAEAPYIIISNHHSGFDPFAIAFITKKYEIRYIGKRELSGSKLAAWVMNQLHMIPVSRHATDMGAMRACMQVLREGQVLGIFPEGTRHQPELMQTVESGAAMIALRAGSPVIPVYINRRIGPFRLTRVYVGEPMDLSDLKAEGLNSDTIKALCDRIQKLYYAMRDKDIQRK